MTSTYLNPPSGKFHGQNKSSTTQGRRQAITSKPQPAPATAERLTVPPRPTSLTAAILSRSETTRCDACAQTANRTRARRASVRPAASLVRSGSGGPSNEGILRVARQTPRPAPLHKLGAEATEFLEALLSWCFADFVGTGRARVCSGVSASGAFCAASSAHWLDRENPGRGGNEPRAAMARCHSGGGGEG